MIDDNFIPTIGSERGLNSLRDSTTCFDIAYDGSIFRFVARKKIIWSANVEWESSGVGFSCLLLVTRLEEAPAWGTWDSKRHGR